MEKENWAKVKDLLEEVLALEPSKRAAFLDESPADIEVLREVESLLAFETESEDLMMLSAVEFSKELFDADEEDQVMLGQSIGPYKIIRELGFGGMGAVYLAERNDGKFEQKVALKLLKREMNTASLRRRFQQERQILASLSHPNIARLLDAGTTDDKIPYLAMEYIDGIPIDDYCSKQALELTQRVELFRKVCVAVNFAHRNLIVHRDLKPSNILITPDGTPKLLDFGISKITTADLEESGSATVTRLGAMTPSYASPEQLRSESVTTATDIYSLGVILYELLSGHRPFETQEKNLRDIYKAVMETDPPAPSALASTFTSRNTGNFTTDKIVTDAGMARRTMPNKMAFSSGSLRGDLDNIVLKTLRKEPERRYSSAESLSEDLRRHLNGLPVTARPNTFSYRAEKFVKRNSLAVLGGGVVALAIIGGIGATVWQAKIAQTERAKAEKRFNDVRTLANSFLFEISPKIENLSGSLPARKLLVQRALEYLDSLSRETGDDPELQSELAGAYEKVGDLQGNPFNPHIGDTKGALQSYERARGIRQQFLDTSPENSKAQSDLAQILERLGNIQAQGDIYTEAQINYGKALELRQKILVQNPHDFTARLNMAKILKWHGLLMFYEADYKNATLYYEKASNIFDQLNVERPDDAVVAEQAAYMYILRGESLGWDTDAEGARVSLQTGIELLLPLLAKYPADNNFSRSVMLAHEKRGENFLDLERYAEAIESYGRSMQIAKNSVAADPQDLQAKRDLALAHKKLGSALDGAGKTTESVESLTAALNIFREIGAADAGNSEAAYDIANTRFSIAEAYLAAKDHKTALEHYEKSELEFQAVLAANPGSTFAFRISNYVKVGIGKCHVSLAEKTSQPSLKIKAREKFRDALRGFIAMKDAGNLGEYDQKIIPELEEKIVQLEN